MSLIGLGCFALPISLAILWKNERRMMFTTHLTDKARRACTVVADPSRPSRENDYKLVYVSGQASNRVNLQDRDFGVVAQDSYRLKRKVEMLQWVEVFHPANSAGQNNDRAYYTYSKQWTETPIDSSQFKNTGFDNPSIYSWPYRSNSAQGQKVKIGSYTLEPGQVSRLGAKRKTKVNWSAEDQAVLQNAS